MKKKGGRIKIAMLLLLSKERLIMLFGCSGGGIPDATPSDIATHVVLHDRDADKASKIQVW